MKNDTPKISFRYSRKEEAQREAAKAGKTLTEILTKMLDEFLENRA
jgi:hypothetical protein